MPLSVRIALGVSFAVAAMGTAFALLFLGLLPLPALSAGTPQPDNPASYLEPESSSTVSSWFLSRIPFAPVTTQKKQLFAVMIENHEIARPHHAGLEKALLVQEFFVEGYISRFVALFAADNLPQRIGPIRSLRPYFVQALLPWTPFVFHAGGSPEALDRVQDHDDVTNFNAIYLEEEYFTRRDGIPAPHDLFLPKGDAHALLRDVIHDVHRTVDMPLYPTGPASAASGATTITVNFYSPLHNVTYTYQPDTQKYERVNGRAVSPATPKNVMVMKMPVQEGGEYGRLTIPTVGKGPAVLFRSGRVYHGTWQRNAETKPYQFLLNNGDPMVFADGQIWITVVESMDRVQWE